MGSMKSRPPRCAARSASIHPGKGSASSMGRPSLRQNSHSAVAAAWSFTVSARGRRKGLCKISSIRPVRYRSTACSRGSASARNSAQVTAAHSIVTG